MRLKVTTIQDQLCLCPWCRTTRTRFDCFFLKFQGTSDFQLPPSETSPAHFSPSNHHTSSPSHDSTSHHERNTFNIQQWRLRHRKWTPGLRHANMLLCDDWHQGQSHLRSRVCLGQHGEVILRRGHHPRSQSKCTKSDSIVCWKSRG